MSYPIVQYADDTLIIMPTVPHQISHVMETLKTFSDFTGLWVNFHKSSLVPINISDEKALNLPIFGAVKKKACLSLIWGCQWGPPDQELMSSCQWFLDWIKGYLGLQQ